MDDEPSSAEREAFRRGHREAVVNAELESHEKRLEAINGSIERSIRDQIKLRGSIEELRDKIDVLAATIATKEAVEADRDAQLRRANEQQISSRQLWLAVFTIATMMIAALVTKGVFF